ncbi:MAG: hypothetical protein IPJ81_06355 [Chitinophagaceae bacterium]|nr:hypothetical protein [Chitinophagaceae bacterium]
MESKLKQLNENSKAENLLVLYKWLGEDINSGKIKNFAQVYEYVSKSKIAEDLGTNKGSFLRTKANNGQLWRIGDILKFCTLTGADSLKVCSLLFKHGK